jgi:two-component system sensor histidine kinase KdpD
MKKRWLDALLPFVAALATIALITLVYRRLIHVNATTVALTFLLSILAASTVSRLAVVVVMSVAATLAYNYYFLPPVGTLTIADPQNWVALFAFLVTAVAGSQLSSRARQEAEEAERRRKELEKLYRFSQRLLTAGNVIELLNSIPRQIVDCFSVGAAALLLADKRKVYRSGLDLPQLGMGALEAALVHDGPQVDAAHSLSFVPVSMGVRVLGSLGISGQALSRQTLEALGTLIAIAIERARAVEQLGKTEATREGERLKSALLDSITHDLRTPLTSIKASVTSLLAGRSLSEAQRTELLTIINEESDRLNRLVGEAGEMARLDAGEVEIKREPHSIEKLVATTMSECKPHFGAREIVVQIPPDLPLVEMDLAHTKEVLRHLLENANQYSAADLPITISAEVRGETVVTSVADRGPGIEELELGLIFDKFYRGRDHRNLVAGTGMGLPIAKAIVEAQGGTLSVMSQIGHGSVFSFSLPVARRAAAVRK